MTIFFFNIIYENLLESDRRNDRKPKRKRKGIIKEGLKNIKEKEAKGENWKAKI